MKKKFSKLKYINIKTLFFNLKYFPFLEAIKLPVLISKHTYFKILKGSIKINTKAKFGIIKIGYNDIGIFDKKRSRTILELNGNIIFEGIAKIGHGSKISVWPNATLQFGERFEISAESTIIATKNIRFGNDVLISWNVLIMDSDLHSIYHDNKQINYPAHIEIGDKVWIGCNSTILKGTILNNNVVVGANSVLTSKYHQNNVILAGNPAKIIKNISKWEV